MHYEKHIIRNFPKDYPTWKKILANLAFFIFGTIIHHRKNLLNEWDIRHSKINLKPGDIILVGELHRASHLVIHGPITHGMIYLGKNKVIHAVADGVEIDQLYDVFCEYDTMVILRSIEGKLDPKNYRRKTKKILNFALEQIGKPFDFEFKMDKKKLYCSELIYSSFKKAGIDTGARISKKEPRIHPIKFINNHLQICFLSHNLKLLNGKIAYVL